MTELTQKFRMGQRCILAFPSRSGWAAINGEECTIVLPKARIGFMITERFSGEVGPLEMNQLRYGVETASGRKLQVKENWLRPLYDGAQLSTWADFAVATGLDLRQSTAT